MSDEFFEPPPPPPEPEPEEEEPPRRPWHGPPSNVLGRAVALNLLLGRTDDVAVTLPVVTVYPDGISFSLALRGRLFDSLAEVEDDWFPHFGERRRGQRSADEALRFGVQFSDGSKATNLRRWWTDESEPPPSPWLFEHGGGGGGREYKRRYWLWPVPPPGPLAFVVEWRAASIPITRTEISADVLREAASGAVELWPEAREGATTVRAEVSSWSGPAIGIERVPDDEDET